MLGKTVAIGLLILGTFILANFLLRIGSSLTSPSEDTLSAYHLGCYDCDHPLNQSTHIQHYLLNLSSSLSQHSVSQVRNHQTYVNRQAVKPSGANAIALQFKKYIVAYENIKNRNEYEQSYNKGIRQARQDFLQCRASFLQSEWDCNGTYARYLKSDQTFSSIKVQLSDIITLKYQEQAKIKGLLQPPASAETDNETYYHSLEELNLQLSTLWEAMKQKNQTLTGLQNREFRMVHDLNSMKLQFSECSKNKKEIEICKNISERISLLFYDIDVEDLQLRIGSKRVIIERYESALAKSMKVGLDVTEIKAKLTQNQKELRDLQDMYNEVETASVCAGDLIKRCSDQHINELEANVTSLELELLTLGQLKKAIQESIRTGQVAIDGIVENKKIATEEYQNSLGSIEKIKEMQVHNLQKLKGYRENINLHNSRIQGMQTVIDQAELERRQTIHDLNGIISRVGELTNCLAKKEYLLKLQSQRPRRSEEDSQLKRQAAEALIQRVRSVYI